LPDGRSITYDHDPLGRRIAKRINGSITEKYLWNGRTQLLAVYDGANNLLMRFDYADSLVPFSMIKGGVKYYLTHDQVGSLRVVTDVTGTVIKRIDYDSFGNIIADSDSSFTIPFGFVGGMHDRDTNLVRFGYRDYLPETGRWTAKDPIGFAGGDIDLYGYTAGDPINFLDPLGLQTCPVALGAGAGLGAGLSAAAPWIAGALAAYLVYDYIKDNYDLYWRCSNNTNNPFGPWLTGKNSIVPPYGLNFKLAQDKLQIPTTPTRVLPVLVSKKEPIAGPQRATKYPPLGSGGGHEWYRGRDFPEN